MGLSYAVLMILVSPWEEPFSWLRSNRSRTSVFNPLEASLKAIDEPIPPHPTTITSQCCAIARRNGSALKNVPEVRFLSLCPPRGASSEMHSEKIRGRGDKSE